MTPETYAKTRRIRGMVHKLQGDLHDFEKDLLKLIAHPDATTEQITEVREKYMDIQDRLTNVRDKLVDWGMKI